jgi:hypothetical protein
MSATFTVLPLALLELLALVGAADPPELLLELLEPQAAIVKTAATAKPAVVRRRRRRAPERSGRPERR